MCPIQPCSGAVKCIRDIPDSISRAQTFCGLKWRDPCGEKLRSNRICLQLEATESGGRYPIRARAQKIDDLLPSLLISQPPCAVVPSRGELNRVREGSIFGAHGFYAHEK